MPVEKKAKAGVAPQAPRIQCTRADAVRFAIANTELEGLQVSKAAEALLNRWADGELDDDELLAAVLDGSGSAQSTRSRARILRDHEIRRNPRTEL